MKTLLAYFYYVLVCVALSLRYKITVRGFDSLTKEALSKKGGTLFLANHPAEIDPIILLRVFWPKFRLKPVAIDYLFQIKGLRYLLDFVGAIPIPNFDSSSNSFKEKQIASTYEGIFDALKKKNNLLIYPAGGLKRQAEEILGGASGVHKILQEAPNTNVVLVRTTGLWGSSFSCAQTGRSPRVGKAFANGFRMVLRNAIFFSPRRKVVVDCMPAPADFPWKGDRLEFNRYLENWYNERGVEPLTLVSYTFWKETLPKIPEKVQEAEFLIEQVPDEIKSWSIKEIAQLASLPEEEISIKQHLATDLGLDSLDVAQLVVAIKEEYGITSLHSNDLTSVAAVMVFAAGLGKSKQDEEEEEMLAVWSQQKKRPAPEYPDCHTLIDGFLRTCERMGDHIACADSISGQVSYKRLKLGIILLAQEIKKMPGERIGIMMPASVAVNALIFATMLAKKVPVMINWTLGKRNLDSIVDQAKIETTLSSWKFLDKLENVELGKVDEQIVLAEEMRRSFSWLDKLRATRLARKKPADLLRHFGCDLKEEDQAVILFTSGTESFPKGVPLTHRNLTCNQQDAFASIDAKSSDVLLGVLPPFHSFGFSVTGIFPLIGGLRVAFSPNPTDGKRMAKTIKQWKVTYVCIAPTFFKNLLRVAKKGQLKSLRMVILGAEKTPQELFEKMHELNPKTTVIEGYGITECSPILTINPLKQVAKGVGKPFPRVELCIVHPDTHEPLPSKETGLILARGPNIFNGYLDPSLSSPFVNIAEERWYQTGDLGYLDEGYLVLSGRLKRFVKIGGEMVSLVAIEETLSKNASQQGWKTDPEKPSLAVIALEEEGKKGTMHLFTTFSTTAEQVNQILRDNGMSNLIKIASVRKVSYIPQLGSGKVDYRTLRSKL